MKKLKYIFILIMFLGHILNADKLYHHKEKTKEILTPITNILNKKYSLNINYNYDYLTDDTTWVGDDKYILTYRYIMKGTDVIAIFRVNKILKKDKDIYKIGNYELRKGSFILAVIDTVKKDNGDKNFVKKLEVIHENELGISTCFVPYTLSDFKIQNLTCKQKWDMYLYQRLGKRTLGHERIMLNRQLPKIDKELELKNFMIDIMDAAIDPIGKAGKGILSEMISESLSAIMPINAKNDKVNKAMGDIYASWIVTVINGGTLGVIDAGIDVSKIINTVSATIDVLDIEIARHNIEIAEKYLDLYYQYGSNQISVTDSLILDNYSKAKEEVYSKLHRYSGLDDVLTQIAINLGYYSEDSPSNLYGTALTAGVERKYDADFTISIIKNIIEKVVSPLTQKNMDNPSLQHYTKYQGAE